MYEVIFLFVLAFVHILFAVVQDIKTREICNWISFSLIIFALGFRFIYSLFEGDGFVFFYMGLMGLGIFFLLGNLFYYGKVFAGGDAKLMIALGTVLPIYSNIFSNLELFFNFLLIFLLAGFAYTLSSSIVLFLRHFKAFKKEFIKQFKEKKIFMIILTAVSILFLLLGFFYNLLFIVGIFIFFISYLYIYSKAIDEACMIKKVKVKTLTEGDWLYSDLKVGNKFIKATWDGLTDKDINEIRKRYHEVKIRHGIPFSPVFLMGLIILIIFTFFNIQLWNPFW